MAISIPHELVSATKILAPFLAASTAGSILCLSYFPLPIIRAVSSDHSTARAMDHIKALFSSGSHIYPPLSGITAGLYGLLAYIAPSGSSQRIGYSVAAVGSIGIAPFTVGVMLGAANQRILDLYEKRKKDGAKAVEMDKKEVDLLLQRFEWLNAIRAAIMASGALAGLYTALVL
jgi:hypothetical protein